MSKIRYESKSLLLPGLPPIENFGAGELSTYYLSQRNLFWRRWRMKGVLSQPGAFWRMKGVLSLIWCFSEWSYA